MEEATAEKLNFIGRFLKLSDALELCDADKTNLQKSLDERSNKVAEIDELFAIIHKDFPEAFSCDNILFPGARSARDIH